MTAYNKIRLAVLAILASQSAAAITLQPLKVMSSSGELLYAEMNFSRAEANTPLEVGLATTIELQQLGINTQTPAGLNFYTRRTGNGNGVIVITSSRPFNDSSLNFVLKVKEGDNTRIQQIKAPLRMQNNAVTASEKPLTPEYVVNEKDIALDLPQSTLYTAPKTLPAENTAPATLANGEQALAISAVAPPVIESKPAVAAIVPKAPITSTAVSATANAATTAASSNLAIRITRRAPNAPAPQPAREKPFNPNSAALAPMTKNSTAVAENTARQAAKTVTSTENKQNSASSKAAYVVQANDSLWTIANRIATQTKQPINQVMQRLKQQNQHAFVQGDANRLRQGVALNLAATNRAKAQKEPQNKSQSKSQKDARSKTQSNTADTASKTAAQSGKAKIKLKEAELKLVAENDHQGERGNSQKSGSVSSDSQLQNQVTQSRQKALKMQKQVSGLALGLGQKEQRIQLLNARLAQLQQQLKQQELALQSKKNTRS